MPFETDDDTRDREVPLRGYAVLLAIHAGLIGGFLGFLRVTGRPLPRRIPPSDLALIGVGTWRASRVATRDVITSPLRAPFTEVEEVRGRSDVHEQPRGHGLRRAIGELVTCPYCLGSWVAAAFTALYVVAPRSARFLGSILAVQVVSNELNRHLR